MRDYCIEMGFLFRRTGQAAPQGGSRPRRRLVFSVEVDWWHSRCSPTSQPLARSSSTLLFDPSKRPNPHGCETSWLLEDLRGRFENRELCPFQWH
jgi:hypothetical protein